MASCARAASQTTAVRCVRLTGGLAFGPQPSPHELSLVSQGGFAGVLNLRRSDEVAVCGGGGAYNPEEGDILAKCGVEYANVMRGSPDAMDDALLDEILATLEALPQPALVHCNNGLTACFVCVVQVAKATRKDSRWALEVGMKLGFNFADHHKLYTTLTRALAS